MWPPRDGAAAAASASSAGLLGGSSAGGTPVEPDAAMVASRAFSASRSMAASTFTPALSVRYTIESSASKNASDISGV